MARLGFITAVLGLLALLCCKANGINVAKIAACNKKGAGTDVRYAIQQFCQNQHIMIPSLYAQNGVWSSQKTKPRAFVTIKGLCSPPTYVPPNICLDQFYDMCATGGPFGGNTRWYGWGKNKCQNWQITVVR